MWTSRRGLDLGVSIAAEVKTKGVDEIAREECAHLRVCTLRLPAQRLDGLRQWK